MKRWTKRSALGLLAAAVLCAGGGWAEAQPLVRLTAARVREYIERFEYAKAGDDLALQSKQEPRLQIERARLALHQGECDQAMLLLLELNLDQVDAQLAAAPNSPPDVPALANMSEPERGALMQLFEVVRVCSRVSAAAVVREDLERGVVARFQDPNDAALFDELATGLHAARTVLEHDLGVTMPSPLRVLVVRDQLSLAGATGLPYDAAKKTGTLGVAKWGRITVVSPRAVAYDWLDTLAHELTHQVITRATGDRAPLWLQEGLAKVEEQRWREPNARDAKQSPQSVTLWGMDRKLDLPLDNLGPSLAMLPSAEQAMVVYAQVQSFVLHLMEHGGAQAVPRLLRELAQDGDVDKALERATGQSLALWEAAFRAELKKRERKPLPPMFESGRSRDAERALGEHMRLAELLLGQGRAREAERTLQTVERYGQYDARYLFLRGKALQAQGESAPALAAMGDPDKLWATSGAYWALRAQLETDESAQFAARIEALRADPLGFEAACKSGAPAALCEAAAHSNPPRLGEP